MSDNQKFGGGGWLPFRVGQAVRAERSVNNGAYTAWLSGRVAAVDPTDMVCDVAFHDGVLLRRVAANKVRSFFDESERNLASKDDGLYE